MVEENTTVEQATVEQTKEQETNLPTVTAVGETLRLARLAKKQDLKDVAAHLCIRYQFLQDLEDCNYKTLPGGVYVNGFIRSYADYLGIDSAELVARYKQEYSSQNDDADVAYRYAEADTENMTPAPKMLILSIVLLFLAFGIWHAVSSKIQEVEVPVENYEDILTKTETGNSDTQVIADMTPEHLKESVDTLNPEPEVIPPVPEKKPAFVEEEAVEVNEVETVEKVVTEQPKKIRRIRVYGQQNIDSEITLVAKSQSWVEVKRDDEVIFTRLLETGDRYLVPADDADELTMKTGNAGGLQIVIDGVVMPSLGLQNKTRSNITLEAEELKKVLGFE